MKHASLVLTGLLATAFTLPALADDAHHPAGAATPAAPQAAPATARAKAPVPEQTVKKMQTNAKLMLGQLNRLEKAKTESEFQSILAEHRQTMRENMMLLRGMAGGDMAAMQGGPGMGDQGMPCMAGGQGMMMHGGPGGMQGGQGMMGGMGAMHDAMMQRMEQMEKRLDVLEQAVKPGAGK